MKSPVGMAQLSGVVVAREVQLQSKLHFFSQNCIFFGFRYRFLNDHFLIYFRFPPVPHMSRPGTVHASLAMQAHTAKLALIKTALFTVAEAFAKHLWCSLSFSERSFSNIFLFSTRAAYESARHLACVSRDASSYGKASFNQNCIIYSS